MNISIRDLNNNVHKFCPRCGSQWKDLSAPEYFFCDNDECGMMACQQTVNPATYFLTVDIEGYNVYWYNDGCMIDRGSNILCHAPNLPFDISYNKLKMYLVFS